MKNRLSNKAFEADAEEEGIEKYKKAEPKDIQVGAKVFVENLRQTGVIHSVRADKKEAEVVCGGVKIRSKFSNLSLVIDGVKAQTKKQKATVEIKRELAPRPMPTLELNVIGKTVHEALPDVAAFIDSAVIANLEEIRIVHGVGTGKLRAGIHDFLRTHKNVAEYRFGRYGEGETGVTIVKIK